MWWLPAALGALSSSLTLLFVCVKKREIKPVSKKGGSSKTSHSQPAKAKKPSSHSVSAKSSRSASAKSAKLSQAKKASVASASSKSASAKSAKSGKSASEGQKNLKSTKSGDLGRSTAHSAQSLKSTKTATAGGPAPAPTISSLAQPAGARNDESQKQPKILGQPTAVGIASKPEKSAKSGRSKKSGRSRGRKSLSKTGPNFGKSKTAAGSVGLSGRSHHDKPKAAPPADGAAPSQPASQPLLVPTAAVPMQLQLAPSDLRFKSAGGLSQVSVLNTTDKRRAIKVKCSDNQLYRVNPVHAFVEPCDTLRIDVLRQNGAAKIDKIVVLAADATKEDTDARAVTARAAAPELMVLPLIANAAE